MSWLRLMEESYKEKENLPAEGHAEATHQPTSGKKHKLVQLIKEMWPAYLIEIVVIIFGISITLALEAWRDQSKENELENIQIAVLACYHQSELNHFGDCSFSMLPPK